MPPRELPTPEAEIRRLVDGGAISEAAETVVRAYGPELNGYLHAIAHCPTEADDAFGDFCVRLMRSLGCFRGESSVRTWSYCLARNAMRDRWRRGKRSDERIAPPESLAEVAASVRSETATFLKTHVKDRLAQIREGLPEEDRTLLILRIDRQMTWPEVTAILLEDPDARAIARLRKRYERLVAKLRTQLRADRPD